MKNEAWCIWNASFYEEGHTHTHTHTHTPLLYLQKETSERTVQNFMKMVVYREGRAQLGAGVDLLS